ncbi:hypothetical protein Hanom_Chr15g01365851 [Helianthus anomalus]
MFVQLSLAGNGGCWRRRQRAAGLLTKMNAAIADVGVCYCLRLDWLGLIVDDE